MKEKRTFGLSCEKARDFPIIKMMAKLGHFPTRTTGKEAWFLSPFRSETRASFKVSKRLNRWYDHGEGIGGNIIDLVCRIERIDVKQALQIIGEEQISFSFQQQQISNDKNHNKIEIIKIIELQHQALIDYLKSRKISLSTARKLVREVHYQNSAKQYFAIGLKNESRGWEFRNKYFKSSSSPKDITLLKNGRDNLIAVEGMFDLLSLFEMFYGIEDYFDVLVLNSTSFVGKGIKMANRYEHTFLFLDNDYTGKIAARKFIGTTKSCFDKSELYQEYKDLNEWLMHKEEVAIGQRISRCVFVATKTILLCSRRSQRLKKNETHLHQVPLFVLRKETAQEKGRTGWHFAIGIL